MTLKLPSLTWWRVRMARHRWTFLMFRNFHKDRAHLHVAFMGNNPFLVSMLFDQGGSGHVVKKELFATEELYVMKELYFMDGLYEMEELFAMEELYMRKGLYFMDGLFVMEERYVVKEHYYRMKVIRSGNTCGRTR